ncbi:hypothetical protein [Flavobacterium crassostreae]|uniref:Uncharacterized protein n=1 Tax=Flavobacterium crassostreae TaxID=1763534 RepID=A0A1B9E5X1_9FLAO|nr:hypothetical protein [Flavobacterium crassostreae]OCB77364.1 hypothetical protein LPBF_05095 [Flavobacterium crassostreae]
MKKKLQADLISIAHRVLQLKNKSDIDQLYLETQKLYEKLSVLKFIDQHYGDTKPTIGRQEIEHEIDGFYATPTPVAASSKPETTSVEAMPTAWAPETAANTIPTVLETVPLAKDTQPNSAPTQQATPKEETIPTAELLKGTPAVTKPEAIQISFEDLLGGNYNHPQFIKVEDVAPIAPEPVFEPVLEPIIEKETPSISTTQVPTAEKAAIPVAPKKASLNDTFSKGIEIDLNDRIAFVKHLFGNSEEDYNRVLNQLITFDTFYETRNFIEEMVKPDYNNWKGKDDYAERFIAIIEKKFL